MGPGLEDGRKGGREGGMERQTKVEDEEKKEGDRGGRK